MSENTIAILKESLPLQNISANINLSDGTCLKASLKEKLFANKHDDKLGEYNQTILCFEVNMPNINFNLHINSYSDFVTVFVDSSIKSDRVFVRQQTFAKENAIEIIIDGINSDESIIGFNHFNDWWTRPFFVSEVAEIPKRTQSLLWKQDENYFYLASVGGDNYKAEISGNDKGFKISLSPFIGGLNVCDGMVFSVGLGLDPYELIDFTTENIIKMAKYPSKMRKTKRYPEIFEYLGWCSWDAFYNAVNEDGLLEKMADLKAKNIPVKWVMIDDGWQDTTNNLLNSFDADIGKFPDGLGSTIKKLKHSFGIQWVGVWHTLFGYWGGINPEGSITNVLKSFLYKTNNGTLLPHPSSHQGFGFWNKFHGSLREQGVDFVKVDSQSAINNFYIDHISPFKAAKGIHSSLEASVGIHFDNCIINCMGMAAENMWNRPSSAISRNSDDFVPTKDNSFNEHSLQNVYNSLFHGTLYWGDWDMFWTKHKNALQNSVLRALSGGPVYFSDRPGETDENLILPLILNDGHVLRCNQPGLPTKDILFRNPLKESVPLKVWNVANGAGFLGAFHINLDSEQMTYQISPSEIPTFSEGKYILYDFFNRSVQVLSYEEKVDCTLEKDGVGLYVFIPFENSCVPIGLLEKYLSPITIDSQRHSVGKSFFTISQEGLFGFISDKEPKQITVNGNVTDFIYEKGLYIVDCTNEKEKPFIEIDF